MSEAGEASANDRTHRLIVCTTCRREGASAEEPTDGGRLYEAVRALFDAWPNRDRCLVTGVECMSGCNRACTVGLAAHGKPSYLFGDLAPTPETAADALALVAQYRDKVDGVMERRFRPPSFRRGVLAKIPPAFALTSEPAAPVFDDSFRARLESLVRWRRDVRRFRPDPIAPDLLDSLLRLAAHAPSVGLSQPWRFVNVRDPARRAAVRRNFEIANALALSACRDDRKALYASLKLAGLDEAPCHLALFAEPAPEQGHGLGRLTMPETIAYSAVMAAHTLWLAARAHGIGFGWVSILDPADIAAILDAPSSWLFIGYFCLGYPRATDDTPDLERRGWERRGEDVSATLLQR